MDPHNFPTAAQWNSVGMRPHHGVLVPLFSLHAKTSCGIGDFKALIPLIDWCKNVGFDTIQLLPINDTGEELSPYYALSSFALDPIYINIPELATPERLPRNQIKLLKMKWLRKKYEEGDHRDEVQEFLKGNSWLDSYARFKDRNDFEFHLFLQFFACEQMKEVKRYATKRGVFLKGDFPISISPKSADVAAYPQLFNLRYSSGAPPDYYNREGQNWGSPIFNWEEMRKEKFAWWKERLRVAEQFFHLYRIDHVMGLFRIWAVAEGEIPSQGRYLPTDPEEWGRQGREALEMLVKNSSMLPMGEDLGVVPEVVRKTLREYGICGTKVLRWEKIPPREYEPISMTTVSTADSAPLQLWWRDFPEEAKRLCKEKGWHYEAMLSVQQRREILRDAHQSGSLFHINPIQEYLALFPDLVSSDPEEERINIPGTVLSTNWTYRMKPSVEELMEHRGLAEEIARMIQ